MQDPNWFYRDYKPSALELLFENFLIRNFPDETFHCQKRVILENGREKYTDFYWKEQDIHIELDGHEKFKRQYLGDFFNRQNLLTLEDKRVIRFTWSNLEELKVHTMSKKYLLEVFNKIKQGKLSADLRFKDEDPFDKPSRRLLSKMKNEWKREAMTGVQFSGPVEGRDFPDRVIKGESRNESQSIHGRANSAGLERG